MALQHNGIKLRLLGVGCTALCLPFQMCLWLKATMALLSLQERVAARCRDARLRQCCLGIGIASLRQQYAFEAIRNQCCSVEVGSRSNGDGLAVLAPEICDAVDEALERHLVHTVCRT